MPTNFFDDPIIFGDRSPKKPKKAIFYESAGHQYAAAFCSIIGPNLVPDNVLCMDIEDKGSI